MPHPDAHDFAEDDYPRTPVTDDQPASWKMVKLHLKQAMMAADVEQADGNIVKNCEHHIQQALWFLRPPNPEPRYA